MEDTTVVVTGGTRGIGRAVAAAFVETGATVVIGARDAETVEETVAELEDQAINREDAVDGGESTETAGSVEGLRTDVRDEFDVERLMETASRAGSAGGIDVIVACAGVYHGEAGQTSTGRESYAAFDDHWRTNARGVFVTISEAIPHLNEGARVLVPTGPVAREGKPGYGSYAISKAGAEAIVRGFAADTEYAVGCLEPGQLATDLTGGRGREPESVAEMFVWAATDLESEELDGEIVGLKDWKRETR